MIKKFDDSVLTVLNPAGAYIVGLYYADGCITATTGGRFVSRLTSKDKDMMVTVKNFFSSTNKLHVTGEGKYYGLGLCSKPLYDSFVGYGLTERKSCNCQVPRIPANLRDPFMMGFFDGDGSLSVNKRINSWKVSFGTCCKQMSDWVIEYLKQKNLIFGVELRKTDTGKDFYNIVLVGLMGKLLLDQLYESVNTHIAPLKRKHLLYQKLILVEKFAPPYYQNWEKKIMSDRELSNLECKTAIEANHKNVGWKRTVGGIYRKRKALGFL